MKNAFKMAAFVLTIGGTALLYSCGNSTQTQGKSDSVHSDAEAHYACPMHPEEHGKKGDKCPKCGMNLEPHDHSQNNVAYYIQFVSVPAAAEPGKEVTWSLTPFIKGQETTPVPLDVVHEKKIHLIAVSKDLSWFEHIHPEYQADGSYQVITTLPAGGAYTLFADYSPSGGAHQVEKINVNVSGTPAKETAYTVAASTWKKDDIEVSVVPEDGKYVTGADIHISGIIKQKGKAVDANTLENYLGAKAHMVVVKTGTYEYIHVHPDVENGNLHLHAYFETPGIYRGWLQFNFNGQLQTADFVINVEQGKAASGHQQADDHNHDH